MGTFDRLSRLDRVAWLLGIVANELEAITPDDLVGPDEKAWTVPAGHLARLRRSLDRLGDRLARPGGLLDEEDD